MNELDEMDDLGQENIEDQAAFLKQYEKKLNLTASRSKMKK